MSNKLSNNDREVLEFRPNIAFVEPEVGQGFIDPIEGTDSPQLEDIKRKRNEVTQLAIAVDTLAKLVQARADVKAQNLKVSLDSKVDQSVIQAMQRRFPGANPNEITYSQYRECKDNIRKKGIEIGRKALVQPSDDFNDILKPAGRPETNPDAQVIEPLDMQDIQINMICILLNFLWATIKNIAFLPLSIPGVGSLGSALPDKLCNPGADIEIPGLQILGLPPVKKQEPPATPTSLPEKGNTE